MKKLVTLALIAVLSFAVLAPATAEAGASTNAALALGAFAVLNQVVRGDTIFHPRQPVYSQYGPIYAPQPSYPVYGPVYAPPAPVVMYPYPQPICVGTLDIEYGFRPHPSGNGLEYAPTGRTFCRGQILYR